ncbi:aureocin A53 family class IId bacteriocin [Streptomyces sp. SM11]
MKVGARYGTRFAKWVWSHTSQIMKWPSAG